MGGQPWLRPPTQTMTYIYVHKKAYIAYNLHMEVPITQFRQRIFELVDQALEGKEVWVRHKGRRVRIVPEQAPSKLSRLTPMQILIPEDFDLDDPAFKAAMLADMEKEWQSDWERDFGPAPKQVAGNQLRTPRKGKKS